MKSKTILDCIVKALPTITDAEIYVEDGQLAHKNQIVVAVSPAQSYIIIIQEMSHDF